MYPVLFEVFGAKLYSYAVLMTAGYLVALLTVFYLVPKNATAGGGGLERAQAWDLFIVMVISSLLGAKIGHCFFEADAHEGVNSVWALFQQDPWHWARLDEPGYVWYGGMIGALSVAVFYFKRRPHLDAWEYSDAFAPAIMTGAALGRTGCFLAGCCYGQPTDVAWGVYFPQAHAIVHPTQAYDALIATTIGALLIWRFARRRFRGENIALLLLLYPVARAITEIFRGDPERGTFGPLSTSQTLSIPLFVIGLVFYVTRRRQGITEDTDANPPDVPKTEELGAVGS